jgi:glycosyltransferase involved in cell wall biosynthesis
MNEKKRPMNISVIIPCYNAEQYLKATLKSLANQTLKAFDLIVVDDGSTDNTPTVVKEFSLNHKQMNIQYIWKNNGGVSSARNLGLKNSNSEYIVFLDSDDEFHPQYLEILYQSITKFDCDLAFGFRSSTRNTELYNLADLDIIRKDLSKKDLAIFFMKRPRPVSFFNFIYKRSIIQEKELIFDEKYKYGEDNGFWWKYWCYIENAIFYDIPIYYYNENNSQSAMKNINWNITDSLNSNLDIVDYIADNTTEDNSYIFNHLIGRSVISISYKFAELSRYKMYMSFQKQYNTKKFLSDFIPFNIYERISSIMIKRTPKLYYKIVQFSKMIKK